MPRKNKKKSTFDPARFLNAFLIFLAVVNCCVIFVFESQRRPQIITHENVVTTNHLIVVTNYISSSVSPSPVVDSNVLQFVMAPDRQVNYPFSFFVWAGRPYVSAYGQNLTVGSPTSYGRILEIYPDRLLLDSGVWLVNPAPAFSDPRRNDFIHTENKARLVSND